MSTQNARMGGSTRRASPFTRPPPFLCLPILYPKTAPRTRKRMAGDVRPPPLPSADAQRKHLSYVDAVGIADVVEAGQPRHGGAEALGDLRERIAALDDVVVHAPARGDDEYLTGIDAVAVGDVVGQHQRV